MPYFEMVCYDFSTRSLHFTTGVSVSILYLTQYTANPRQYTANPRQYTANPRRERNSLLHSDV
jgi:hypothetical protein